MSRCAANVLPRVAQQCCWTWGAQLAALRALSSAPAGPSGCVATLASRGVLQAEGAQTLQFLQGLVTNDVRPLDKAGPGSPPVYASILTPKGKFLHDVFIHPHPDRKDVFLLDVDRAGSAAAMQLLNRYKLRRPIALTDVSSSFRVAACWGTEAAPAGPWWRPDPRRHELGFRAVLPAEAGTGAGTADAGEEAYRALRYRCGVAEGEAEIPTGQAAPLDYNMDELSGVSYTKGCYVGQERNSFTHYRGVIRKRLMPVRLEPREAGPGPSSTAAASLPAAGAEVVDAASGRGVGTIRGAARETSGPASSSSSASSSGSGSGGAVGIAYLRLDVALPAAEGQGPELAVAVAAGEGGAGTGTGAGAWRVVPVRPGWWPKDWGREEEAVWQAKETA